MAWSTVSLVTSGTLTAAGPLETKNVTFVPTGGVAPAGGMVSITWPAEYWLLD